MTPEELISKNHEHLLEQPHKYLDRRIIETLSYNLSLGKKVLSNFNDIDSKQIIKIIQSIREPEFNSHFAKAIVEQDIANDKYNLPFSVYIQLNKGYFDEMEQSFTNLLVSCSNEDLNPAIENGRINYDSVDKNLLANEVAILLSRLGDHERLITLKAECPKKALIELDLGFILEVNKDQFELLAWLGIASIEICKMYNNEELFADEQNLNEFYKEALFLTNDVTKTILSLTLKYPDKAISQNDLKAVRSNDGKMRAETARAGITSRKFLTEEEKEEIKAFALQMWPSLPERRNSKSEMISYVIENLECAKGSAPTTISGLLVNIKDKAI